MAFDTEAVATKLVGVLAAVTGVSAAQLGVPESFSSRLSAFVTMGAKTQGRKATGSTYVDHAYFVNFVYRVGGAEATAEAALMDAVDEFLQDLYDDLTLDGTCEGLEIDASAGNEPEYRMYAGKEFRDYPVLVTARQYGTYATNP